MDSTLQFIPPLIAHRGASTYAPENTLAAFLKARELGFQWVEFDVQLAACGSVVIIHDDTLNRTTNRQGYVHDFSSEELKIVDAGSWFSSHFAKEKIPTLSEAISCVNAQRLSANIEIKCRDGYEKEIAERVLTVIDQDWKGSHSKFFISSFSFEVLRSVRKKSASCQIAFLMDEWDTEWLKKCDEINAVSVNLNQAILTEERAAMIKSTGRLLLVYTVNDQLRAQELFSWGVDAVFTDTFF